MIARLHIVVPFNMVIPVAVEFKLYTYEDDGYDVTGIVPIIGWSVRAGGNTRSQDPDEPLLKGLQSVRRACVMPPRYARPSPRGRGL